MLTYYSIQILFSTIFLGVITTLKEGDSLIPLIIYTILFLITSFINVYAELSPVRHEELIKRTYLKVLETK